MYSNKSFVILMSTLALSSACMATELAASHACATNSVSETKDLKAAEIGTALSALLDTCDRVEATLLNTIDKKTSILPVDKDVIAKLKTPLGSAPYKVQAHCFCFSYPSYSFFQGDKLVLTLSFHHGHKIRISGETLTGDYEVGENTVKAARAILNSGT